MKIMSKDTQEELTLATPGSEPKDNKLTICVFCSATNLDDKYTQPAQKFAHLLAENGYTLVWGGSDKGLMNVVAAGAQQGGAKIIGVSVEYLRDKARKGADKMIIAKDLGERKAIMLSRSDILVMMVGGIGTLDEATEILEHKKLGHHHKPLIILNTEGFYDGLHQQLTRMEQEGFLRHNLEDYVYFARSPEEAIDYINNLRIHK